MHGEPAATNLPSGPGRVRPGLPRVYRYALLALALCLTAGPGSLAAPSPAAAAECPNAAFRTGPSAHLPDCRAYELVTPPFKDAGGVSLQGLSPDGSSALLDITGAVAGIEGFPEIIHLHPGAFYSTRRTASGWTTVPDDPPSSEYLPYLSSGFEDFTGVSLDTQATVFMGRGVGQPANRVDFFMRRPDRSIVDVGPGLPPTAPPRTHPNELGEPADMYAVGVSADASRLFFALRAYFWPFDGTEENRGIHTLYEYLGTENTTPMLVGVNDEGKQISQCGVVLGSGERYTGSSNFSHNAVSRDGNTVFFTAYPDIYGASSCSGSAPPVAELFARIDNGLAGAHTVAISEPSKEDCSVCHTEASVLANAQFVGASEDGSKVFFETRQPLLGSDTSSNLYEYDFAAPAGARIVQVSGGDATVSSPAAEDLENASPLVSEDGSHVYFLANGVLTRTPNGMGESAEGGAANLYVFERDAGFPAGRIAFVARLSPQDLGSWERVGFAAADVTPDGRFLVFTSYRDLTPDDTSTAQQVFEYDAQTGGLVRVSIGQDGFNHNGNVPANNATIVTIFYGAYSASDYWSHLSVSADGSYVFFQSIAGLTPRALDHKVIEVIPEHKENGGVFPPELIYANNVYEYHAGRVSLISDGQDIVSIAGSSVVELLGTDASGADVFFETADRLVGQDTDSNLDIYDARVGGGFPAPVAPASCSGEACQGQLSGAPALLSPGSEFQAGGNPPLAAPAGVSKPRVKAQPRRCRSGMKVKHVRCVKAKVRARKASGDRRGKR